MKTSLKAALVLGATPLVVGLGIFAAWALTHAAWLMNAGLITIYGGIAVVAGALVFLASYVLGSWRSRSVPRRRLVWQTIGVIILLLANFAAAGAAVVGAVLLETRYTLSVTNQSNVAIDSARVDGGGVNLDLGVIAPGATVQRTFRIAREGELVLHGTQGAKKIETSIDGYVTPNLGGDKSIVVAADGTVIIKDQRRK
jgi:hypothetical protein